MSVSLVSEIVSGSITFQLSDTVGFFSNFGLFSHVILWKRSERYEQGKSIIFITKDSKIMNSLLMANISLYTQI